MVSPSSALEYQPTIYAWLILFFVVFPTIYLSGKVTAAILRLLFRVLFYVIEFLTLEWLMKSAEEELIMEDITETIVSQESDVKRREEKIRRREKRREKNRERQKHREIITKTKITVVEEERDTGEDGLGSEAETTTDEGLKCSQIQPESTASGFVTTTTHHNGSTRSRR
ncbi:unnamed protein product, partial [Mesorhabditis belari]|uniref:Uncharacterized protein n=1 Tax=Mesorhabditis belari TaxID=2138241 RepID=A0AAF3F229_9BILA